MPGTGFHYARTKTILWAIFGPLFPIFFGTIAVLTLLKAPEWVVFGVTIPLIIGLIVAAIRYTSVPVDVSLSRGGLRVRALRGWHPYGELDLDAAWVRVRGAAFGQHTSHTPKAWLLIRLRDPALTFSLAGPTEAIQTLQESIVEAMPEQDDEAAEKLADSISGRGFWTSPAATFITLGFAALWAVITGAGVMQMLGRMETERPFPWLTWLVLTALTFAWLRLYLSARKPK